MTVIPSGVEESFDASEGTRDVAASRDMTTKLYAALDVYHDDIPHSAAMNMAIDEALLDHAAVPSIRFYRWQSPALSFGYFGKFADVADYASERKLIRRWTGGGIVFHGDDLTYSIMIPASDTAFALSSLSLFENIHRALCEAVATNGRVVQLATVAALCERRRRVDSPIIDRRNTYCFANPVRADVMIDGRKIAGAAQRRTRHGLLQQGSIQGVDLGNGLIERFAKALAANHIERRIDEKILDRARDLTHCKYGTDFWLRKR